jgi:homocysteine S-methyltransferase
MNIAYELNPPRVTSQGNFDKMRLDSDLAILRDRALQLYAHVDGIHLTDSVLGVPRVASTTAASLIKQDVKSTKLSCSIRTCDRNIITLCQAATDAAIFGIDSLLILLGDAPTDGRDSGLKPSQAVKILREHGFEQKIKMDLSFPAQIPSRKSPAIQAKIEAKPHAFVTQSISSLFDLAEIVDLAKPHGIKVVACIMAPSEKNKQSAKMIGLDWTSYEKEPIEFVKSAGRLAGNVLLTSPNSFASGLELLKEIR